MKHESSETDRLVRSSAHVEAHGCGTATAMCNPHKGYFRFVGLVLVCCLSLGNAFCTSIPTALQNHFIKDLNINTATFAQLISLKTWPNIVCCVLGGYLTDRVFGIRFGAIVFSAMVLVGHFMFAFGALVDQIWLIGVGSVVFG